MFNKDIYVNRRSILTENVKTGIIVMLGNNEVPMNYADNPYYFRQDSTFLYYFGLDLPGLAAVIDVDNQSVTIYGNNISLEDIIWMGPQESLADQAAQVGIENVNPSAELKSVLKEATGSPKITLRGIIDLFALHNYKLADNFQPDVPINELYNIREYDRELKGGFTGSNTEAEMEELEASIKRKGIKHYGSVNITRLKNGDVTAILGEGNHRLKIAKKLRIKTMPIMFFYGNA